MITKTMLERSSLETTMLLQVLGKHSLWRGIFDWKRKSKKRTTRSEMGRGRKKKKKRPNRMMDQYSCLRNVRHVIISPFSMTNSPTVRTQQRYHQARSINNVNTLVLNSSSKLFFFLFIYEEHNLLFHFHHMLAAHS